MYKVVLIGLVILLTGCQQIPHKDSRLMAMAKKIGQAQKNYESKISEKSTQKKYSRYCMSDDLNTEVSETSYENIMEIGDKKLSSKPSILKRMGPTYPPKAKTNGIEGYATAAFIINEQGCYTNIKILKSHPLNVFDDAMIDVLKRWKAKPDLL